MDAGCLTQNGVRNFHLNCEPRQDLQETSANELGLWRHPSGQKSLRGGAQGGTVSCAYAARGRTSPCACWRAELMADPTYLQQILARFFQFRFFLISVVHIN